MCVLISNFEMAVRQKAEQAPGKYPRELVEVMLSAGRDWNHEDTEHVSDMVRQYASRGITASTQELAFSAIETIGRERLLKSERARQVQSLYDERVKKEDLVLGQRFRDCTFDSWIFQEVPRSGKDRELLSKVRVRQEKVVATVREYSDSLRAHLRTGCNLVLLGPVGCGKDHLMSAVAKVASRLPKPSETDHALMKPRPIVAACVGANFYVSMREAMNGKSKQSESQIIRQFTDVPLLLLSDPTLPGGAELTPYQRGALFHVVNERSCNLRPTICTINAKNLEDIAAKLSPQIADRLLDGAVVVECNWPSYRKAKQVVYSRREECT